MRNASLMVLVSIANVLLAVPAHAADSVAIAEPGALTLLSIGVVGLLVGRHIARKPPRD